ncbi:MAG TPA: lipid-A-disaccharide synthase [Verrucomicrobiae bacterium]|jgi:lipid-A-disaccharide synthase|nr:lipid-A-disaccharide synthase [Verrucomicrobiae bacterium]
MAGIDTVKTFMLIAGEPSGDLLASELVLALRERWPDAKFFGAGGPKMEAAGVELAFDMRDHAIIGIPTPGKILALRYVAHELRFLAAERRPDAIIGVDYGGFNLRFGHIIKSHARANPLVMGNPKLVQFVSPQVWASRPGRAQLLESDYDLLLSIFPFEKQWYAQRAPKLRVDFVGHPMIDRLSPQSRVHRPESTVSGSESAGSPKSKGPAPMILLLPGSRKGELKQHLPVMLGAMKIIRAQLPAATAKMVLPNEELKQIAVSAKPDVEIQVGNLHEALAGADLAITKTGTVTMECAYFGVPAVTMYKKTFLGLAITLGIVTVKSLTMPNLMAGEEVYPEFIQAAATPENIARAAMELLQNEPRRQKIKSGLVKIIASLGEPGASRRAAEAISSLFQ